MAENSTLTPAERIALVQDDKTRRGFQIGIAVFIIAFGIGFLVWFVLTKADANFLNYMAVGVLALVFGGMGAAYAIFGLGRTVGSSNTANQPDIAQILALIHQITAPKNTPGPIDSIPDIENPVDDEPATLHEELPAEVPPSRDP